MKKIMFDDRYGLTDAVLIGRKTQTRRIIPITESDSEYLDTAFDWDLRESVIIDRYSRYKVGETVAIAQRYKDAISTLDWVNKLIYQDEPGWNNKMFVRADLMPHGIRITNNRIEHLQDISEEDCMKEGIMEGEFMNTWDRYYFDEWGDVANHITFKSPREAYKALIDRISGKGTWKRNPWTYVYDFELVELE